MNIPVLSPAASALLHGHGAHAAAESLCKQIVAVSGKAAELTPLFAVAAELVASFIHPLGRSSADSPCEAQEVAVWAATVAEGSDAAGALALRVEATWRDHPDTMADAGSGAETEREQKLRSSLVAAARSRVSLAHRRATPQALERSLQAEAAIYAAAGRGLDAALRLLARGRPSLPPVSRRLQAVFEAELKALRGKGGGGGAEHLLAPTPWAWAAWAEAHGRAQAAAPHERFVPPDLSAVAVVGEGLALPPPLPAEGLGPRLTATGRGLCDAMEAAIELLPFPPSGPTTDPAVGPASPAPFLGSDAALATARFAAGWVRSVVLTPGAQPTSWDGGRPGSSWARHIARAAGVASDVLEVRSRLEALLDRSSGDSAPSLRALASTLRTDALAAISILATWVRDASLAHVAPAMGVKALSPGPISAATAAAAARGGAAGAPAANPGDGNGSSRGSSSGGGGGGRTVEEVAPSGSWSCCSARRPPESGGGGTAEETPRRHTRPHGVRVAPDHEAAARSRAAAAHPYAARQLVHDQTASAPPLRPAAAADEDGEEEAVVRRPAAAAAGAPPPQPPPLSAWVHLAALLLRALPQAPPPLLLPPDPAQLAPLLALRPSRQIVGVAQALLLPLLRGTGGLRADVSEGVARIAVDCVLAAFLGALRGGSVGLAYPRLRSVGSGGCGPLVLLAASPTPSRATLASVGLSPSGAVQWAADLLFLRLWLALGAPVLTAASAVGAGQSQPESSAGALFSPPPPSRAATASATPVPGSTVATPARPPWLSTAQAPVAPRTAGAAPHTAGAPRTAGAPPRTAGAPHPAASSSSASKPPPDEVPGGFSELAAVGALALLGDEPAVPLLPAPQLSALEALAARALERHSSTCGGRGIARLLPAPLAAAAASTALHAASQASCDLTLLRLLIRAAESGTAAAPAPPLDAPALTRRLRAAWAVVEACAPPASPAAAEPLAAGDRAQTPSQQQQQRSECWEDAAALMLAATGSGGAPACEPPTNGDGGPGALPVGVCAAALGLGAPEAWCEALGAEVYGATAIRRLIADLQLSGRQ